MFDSPFDFSAVMRIYSHASPTNTDNYPDNNVDAYTKRYAAAAHRNAFADDHAYAWAEIRACVDREF